MGTSARKRPSLCRPPAQGITTTASLARTARLLSHETSQTKTRSLSMIGLATARASAWNGPRKTVVSHRTKAKVDVKARYCQENRLGHNDNPRHRGRGPELAEGVATPDRPRGMSGREVACAIWIRMPNQ